MSLILVTGATGLLGSALSAAWISQGGEVVALSRNDPDRGRTWSAVRDAAKGFGFNPIPEGRLQVIPTTNGQPDEPLPLDIVAIWHCAAEMTFDGAKLEQSYRTNVSETCDLYRAVCDRLLSCRRFYYVSTAYTAGMTGGDVYETLHAGPSCVNVYQVTKWCAEHALRHLHGTQALPVTIVRPSLIVGHEVTGWTRRNDYGVYRYLTALRFAKKSGASSVRIDVRREARPDIVPIDRVASAMIGLTQRHLQGNAFEIFHATGGTRLTLEELLCAMGDVLGVNVSIGAPRTEVDRQINDALSPVRRFGDTDWRFDRRQLDATVPAQRKEAIGAGTFRHLIEWYVKNDKL